MSVKTFQDLDRYLKSSTTQNAILNSQNTQKVLVDEAERLKSCIQKRLDEYYDSRKPKVYNRSYNLQQSLRLDDEVKISVDKNTLQVEIYFDEDSATGHSLFGDGTVRKSDLINYGYEVKKNTWFKDIENFGYREGALFIEKGVERFNQSNPHRLKIEVVGKRKVIK